MTDEDAIVKMCTELRALGATEVAYGDFHVKFGPPIVKITRKDAADGDPDEWRRKAVKGE